MTTDIETELLICPCIDIERIINFKVTFCKFSDCSGSLTDNFTNWPLNPDVATGSSGITEDSVDLLHLPRQPYMVFLEIPYRLANPAPRSLIATISQLSYFLILTLPSCLVYSVSYFFNCKKRVVYPSLLLFIRPPSPWHYNLVRNSCGEDLLFYIQNKQVTGKLLN